MNAYVVTYNPFGSKYYVAAETMLEAATKASQSLREVMKHYPGYEYVVRVQTIELVGEVLP